MSSTTSEDHRTHESIPKEDHIDDIDRSPDDLDHTGERLYKRLFEEDEIEDSESLLTSEDSTPEDDMEEMRSGK